MSLQLALMLMGLVALGLVLLFSYARGRVKFLDGLPQLLRLMELFGRLGLWVRKEPRALYDRPSPLGRRRRTHSR